MKVVYTFQARQDLKNIYAYITYTPLAPEAAEKLINEIIQKVNTLIPCRSAILSIAMNHGTVGVFATCLLGNIWFSTRLAQKTILFSFPAFCMAAEMLASN